MSVFKKQDTVSLAMMVNMVTFATWNVLVLAVDHVIEEMEFVGSVENIDLILTVIRHVQIIVKKIYVIESLVNVKIV